MWLPRLRQVRFKFLFRTGLFILHFANLKQLITTDPVHRGTSASEQLLWSFLYLDQVIREDVVT